ncbi:vitamin K epoxide reductase complex subunit 1-like protein 1 [Aethina tumida]|uniref:vitamin K epoxide reductase complex subunit 1-like protein 1 n=1 Tax=Aethina tumida TaxID=116153 RepID=UPI00096AEFAF|nr:vitamin K epoxide reductase complex subunit 1-like protein 1 [Aethina tumida]
MKLSTLNTILTISSLIGLGLSIYAYYVGLNLEVDPQYEPLCDIHFRISCSKPFMSRYGKGFGLFPKDSIFYKPNSLFGIFYYSLLTILAQTNTKFTTTISFIAILFSNVASLWFAYILYFKLFDLCLVCAGTYVVNFTNLLSVNLKLKEVNDAIMREKKKKRE